MKIIKYNLSASVNRGTPEEPVWEEVLTGKTITCSADVLEANLAVAQAEAHNGEYTVEDDGYEEEKELTPEERIAELEDALALILSGVTE